MSLPEQQRKFVLVVPYSFVNKSNGWTSSLSLKYFAQPPEDIVLSTDVFEFRKQYPEISQFVLVDDAAFSGNQISPYTWTIPGTVNLIVPFMTERAFSKVAAKNVWVAQHEKMMSVEELDVFSSDEKKLLEKLIEDDNGDLSWRSLTWFDHKIPDQESTLSRVLELGQLLTGEKPTNCRFIPQADAPYNRA